MYEMGARRGVKSSTDALLQRVSSQLSGKIIQDNPPSDDEDDLQGYLSLLNKKKVIPAQPKWDQYGEASDISITEDDVFQPVLSDVNSKSTPASKFLKKKLQPNKESQQKQNKHNESVYRGSRPAGKKMSPGANYSSQVINKTRVSSLLSDSDLDMNLSLDEEVLADVQSWKRKPGTKDIKIKSQQSDDSSSMNIGQRGSRFLKKKTASEVQQEKRSQEEGAKKDKDSKPKSRKHHNRSYSDVDENTLSEVHGISSHSPTPPKSKPKRRNNTEKINLMVDTQSVDESEQDNSYPAHGRVFMAFSGDSGSDGDNVKLNVMDLDDLEPANDAESSQKQTKKKTKKQKGIKADDNDDDDDVFNMINLQTVEELLGAAEDLSAASEVKTEDAINKTPSEPYESDFEPTSASSKAPAPLKSILATPRSPKTTPRSARGRVRYSLDDDVKIRSRSPSPEVISTAHGSELSSVIHTEGSSEVMEISTAQSVPEETDGSGSETYTDDYSEDFSTPSSHSVTDKSLVSRQHRQGSDVYSDDFLSGTDVDERTKTSRSYSRRSSRDSFSDEYTSYTESSRSRTPSPDIKQKKAHKCKDRKVQTGLDMGLLYHWNPQVSGSALLGPQYGMAFVDPTPIATHVVSAEALEAVTGYSPSVIALNDLLRQQLALTNHFLEIQKRLHDSYSRLVPPDYQYTTLADTKKYIKQHKKKIITFEEALEQVKAEMGLE